MKERQETNETPERNDYLWDRTGEVDPEVRRLENLLGALRHEERAEEREALEAKFAEQAERGATRGAWTQRTGRLAAAAVVLLGLTAGIIYSLKPVGPTTAESAAGWTIGDIEGTPRVGARAISSGQAEAKLGVGQTLETNGSSSASVSEEGLGRIQIEPNSRVRLVQSGPERKVLRLEVGTIRAVIWAPPGEFMVDTPSALAVDLGCAYTLQVAGDGAGTIRTTVGWVGFEKSGRHSFIPAGAICKTRPRTGPGVPYFEDAPEGLRQAVDAFDAAGAGSAAGDAAVAVILKEARERDGLTLWHLLWRTAGDERAQVYERMAAVAPPPAGVTREGVLRLDAAMMDAYWNTLGLGDISIWRFWEQKSGAAAGR